MWCNLWLIKQWMGLGLSRLDNIARARVAWKNLFYTLPRIFNFKHITVDSFHRKWDWALNELAQLCSGLPPAYFKSGLPSTNSGKEDKKHTSEKEFQSTSFLRRPVSHYLFCPLWYRQLFSRWWLGDDSAHRSLLAFYGLRTLCLKKGE